MRKFNLGAATPAKGWSPQFNIFKPNRNSNDKLGKKNTPIMSYFPTLKGEPRMEELRHYFHKDYALMLDARPIVTAWTADTKPITFKWHGRAMEFTPDFHVVEGEDDRYSVRLIRSGTKDSEVRAERHRAVTAAYEAEDEDLVVITAEELAADPHLPAAKSLFLNRVRDWPEELPEALADAWAGRVPTTLGDVHHELGGGKESWLQLLSLAAEGFLILDLDGGLVPETTVFVCRTRGYRL